MKLLTPIALSLAVALPAAAAERTQDPTLVLTRTVQPRVAYHALPPEENPAAASVATFPARVFHGAVDNATRQVADQLLGATFGDGQRQGVTLTGSDRAAELPLLFGTARGRDAQAPIGPGASMRGAVSGVTSSLRGLIGDALSSAGGGGGP